MASQRPRVWLLTNAPSPYQVELLTETARQREVDLQVRFMRVPEDSILNSRRDASLPYRELAGLAPRQWRDEFRLHPRAVWEALRGDFDVYILSGLYTSVTFLTCAAALSLRGKPWAVWLEQPHPLTPASRGVQPPGSQGRGWRRMGSRFAQNIRGFVLRRLLRRSHRVIGIGSAAVEAYRELGTDPDKLLMLPYCCDIQRFAHVSQCDVDRIRDRYSLAEKTVFLFSGQMIERKGIDVLLRAFERLAEQNGRVALLLLGDGPLKQHYQHSVPARLRDRVHFAGFLQQEELPAHFAAADVFVFPSRRDGWGVVINEACAAGLPIIASRQTGAARDLVENGESGFVLDCEDVDGFAETMRFFVEHPEQIPAFGGRSRQMVERFSVDRGAERLAAISCQLSVDS